MKFISITDSFAEIIARIETLNKGMVIECFVYNLREKKPTELIKLFDLDTFLYDPSFKFHGAIYLYKTSIIVDNNNRKTFYWMKLFFGDEHGERTIPLNKKNWNIIEYDLMEVVMDSKPLTYSAGRVWKRPSKKGGKSIKIRNGYALKLRYGGPNDYDYIGPDKEVFIHDGNKVITFKDGIQVIHPLISKSRSITENKPFTSTGWGIFYYLSITRRTFLVPDDFRISGNWYGKLWISTVNRNYNERPQRIGRVEGDFNFPAGMMALPFYNDEYEMTSIICFRVMRKADYAGGKFSNFRWIIQPEIYNYNVPGSQMKIEEELEKRFVPMVSKRRPNGIIGPNGIMGEDVVTDIIDGEKVYINDVNHLALKNIFFKPTKVGKYFRIGKVITKIPLSMNSSDWDKYAKEIKQKGVPKGKGGMIQTTPININVRDEMLAAGELIAMEFYPKIHIPYIGEYPVNTAKIPICAFQGLLYNQSSDPQLQNDIEEKELTIKRKEIEKERTINEELKRQAKLRGPISKAVLSKRLKRWHGIFNPPKQDDVVKISKQSKRSKGDQYYYKIHIDFFPQDVAKKMYKILKTGDFPYVFATRYSDTSLSHDRFQLEYVYDNIVNHMRYFNYEYGDNQIIKRMHLSDKGAMSFGFSVSWPPFVKNSKSLGTEITNKFTVKVNKKEIENNKSVVYDIVDVKQDSSSFTTVEFPEIMKDNWLLHTYYLKDRDNPITSPPLMGDLLNYVRKGAYVYTKAGRLPIQLDLQKALGNVIGTLDVDNDIIARVDGFNWIVPTTALEHDKHHLQSFNTYASDTPPILPDIGCIALSFFGLPKNIKEDFNNKCYPKLFLHYNTFDGNIGIPTYVIPMEKNQFNKFDLNEVDKRKIRIVRRVFSPGTKVSSKGGDIPCISSPFPVGLKGEVLKYDIGPNPRVPMNTDDNFDIYVQFEKSANYNNDVEEQFMFDENNGMIGFNVKNAFEQLSIGISSVPKPPKPAVSPAVVSEPINIERMRKRRMQQWNPGGIKLVEFKRYKFLDKHQQFKGLMVIERLYPGVFEPKFRQKLIDSNVEYISALRFGNIDDQTLEVFETYDSLYTTVSTIQNNNWDAHFGIKYKTTTAIIAPELTTYHDRSLLLKYGPIPGNNLFLFFGGKDSEDYIAKAIKAQKGTSLEDENTLSLKDYEMIWQRPPSFPPSLEGTYYLPKSGPKETNFKDWVLFGMPPKPESSPINIERMRKRRMRQWNPGSYKVIITVPHALSDRPDDEHFKDHKAPETAQSLHRKIQFSTLHSANVKREDVDLNRKEGRNTIYRKKLRELMENADLLIDVHSYPPNTELRGEFDAVLLFHPQLSASVKQHQDIISEMEKEGVNAKVLYNTYGCDIISEFPKRGILLEVNESNNNMEHITRAVARAVSPSRGHIMENPPRDLKTITFNLFFLNKGDVYGIDGKLIPPIYNQKEVFDIFGNGSELCMLADVPKEGDTYTHLIKDGVATKTPSTRVWQMFVQYDDVYMLDGSIISGKIESFKDGKFQTVKELDFKNSRRMVRNFGIYGHSPVILWSEGEDSYIELNDSRGPDATAMGTDGGKMAWFKDGILYTDEWQVDLNKMADIEGIELKNVKTRILLILGRIFIGFDKYICNVSINNGDDFRYNEYDAEFMYKFAVTSTVKNIKRRRRFW